MKKKIYKKKKKKGFTLIELLAVILILGIIALIAIPTVTSVVEQSRRGAAESSAKEFVKAVDEYIVLSELSGDIVSDGNYEVADLINAGLNIKGSVPTEGYITIKNNEVVSSSLLLNDYVIGYDDGEYKTIKNNRLEYGKAVYFNPETGKNCKEEDSVSIIGTNSGCMKWYVLYDDNLMVDLILDHNIVDFISWNEENTKNGPSSEFMETLKEKTKNWFGIPLRKDTYSFNSDNSSYILNYAGYRAKYPSAYEIARASGLNDFDETKNTNQIDFDNGVKNDNKYHWLYDYTFACQVQGCLYRDDLTYGYWTSTAKPSTDVHAISVEWDGCLRYYRPSSTSDRNGIRPVISISKIYCE